MTNKVALKNFWVKLDRLLGAGVLLGVFCLIFVIAHSAIFDLDIWLHLKSGEVILKNGIIPFKDIFSFTLPGKPWNNHEWLFQVLAYFIYSKWQIDALIFLESFVITLSFLVLFLIGYRIIKSYIEAAVLILLIAYACAGRFNIRPDIFSLFFFALYLYIIKFHIDKKSIWLLLPLQVLWVNFHGYFFLGPLLIFLLITAEFLRRRMKFLPWQWKEESALTGSAYNRLKKLFFFVVLACFLNPRGLGGALYPLYVFKEVLVGKTHIFFEHIQELQPTFEMVKPFSAYTLAALLSGTFMLINFKRLKIIDILLVLFFFPFALKARNVAFFAFIGYSIIISYLALLLNKIFMNIKIEIPFRQRIFYLFRYGMAIILIVWLGIKTNRVLIRSYYDFQNKQFTSGLLGIADENYPKQAVDFILANDMPANMFNDFNSGAYLIGRAYPQRKVFIDGRTEFYGPEFFRQYQDIIEGNVFAFERIMDKYQITAILLTMSRTSMAGIVKHIYKSPQWKLVFLDENAVVFLKDIPSNRVLIEKYKIDLSKYTVPTADLKGFGLRWVYPQAYIKRAELFNLLEEDGLVILESKEALRIIPDCFEAYQLLGKAYLRKKLYPQAFENLRAAVLLSPRNAKALTELGACLKELKEIQTAIKTLKRAIRFNRHYAPAYYQLSSIYLTINNEREAILSLNKAIKYDSENPLYHFKLGEALYEKGKKTKDASSIVKAKEELEKASKLNIQDNRDLGKDIQDKLKEIKDYLSVVRVPKN